MNLKYLVNICEWMDDGWMFEEQKGGWMVDDYTERERYIDT